MSDTDSSISKLNGSSGFISYEESKSEGWSSESSVYYAVQNKRNHKKLLKRRNQISAHKRVLENVAREENHVPLNRTSPDGKEDSSVSVGAKKSLQESKNAVEPLPLSDILSANTRAAISADAKRTVEFYRRFGDYWNVFPKTDYVYSRHSQWYGSEVAPGILRLPNMCRPTYRGRYDSLRRATTSSETRESVNSEFDETWFVRIRRIVRTSVTTTVTTFVKVAKTAVSPIVTATSSVGSAAAATVSSASSATYSWFSQTSSHIFSASAARSSDEESPNSGNRWSLLFLLLLLLVPVIYMALHGIDLPPPYVPSFIEDISEESLYSTLQRLSTPFASLWGGALWLGSLLVKSLLMIPTLLTETSSILYGFFQYYATTASIQSSIPSRAPLTSSSTVSGITHDELNNLKLWVSEMMSTRMRELKEELDVRQRQPDSQKDILDTLMLVQSSITKFEESNLLMLNRIGKLEESHQGNQLDARVKQMESLTAEQTIEIASIVQHMLEEYHADQIGKPDYALSSNGGAIASVRCTRSFNKRAGQYVLWGILQWEYINTPDIIIKPGYMPGDCWAFEGANGYVVIQLSMPIFVSGFSIEHTPKNLTPLGHIESAPRKFSVWGLSSLEDIEQEFLGRFEFEDNGKSLQSFEAISMDKPFHLVELRIESNHGHLEFTCLYRFRVHGRPAP